MNLPCSVIRDLLPLYTENLASEESMNLVNDHLADCAACREYRHTNDRGGNAAVLDAGIYPEKRCVVRKRRIPSFNRSS